MSLIKKFLALFSSKNKVQEDTESEKQYIETPDRPEKKLEVEDLRENKSDLQAIPVVDDEQDPVTNAMLNAAFNSDKPIMGNIKDGKFTIQEVKD